MQEQHPARRGVCELQVAAVHQEGWLQRSGSPRLRHVHAQPCTLNYARHVICIRARKCGGAALAKSSQGTKLMVFLVVLFLQPTCGLSYR